MLLFGAFILDDVELLCYFVLLSPCIGGCAVMKLELRLKAHFGLLFEHLFNMFLLDHMPLIDLLKDV